jgi:hypothetical protein
MTEYVNIQVSSDMPVWIGRCVIRNRLHSLYLKGLDEEIAFLSAGIRSPEFLQVLEKVLKCRNIIFF